jgi:PAS domain S-box-containing protein
LEWKCARGSALNPHPATAEQDSFAMLLDSKEFTPEVEGSSSARSGAARAADCRQNPATPVHSLAVDDAFRLLLVDNPSPAYLFDPRTLRIVAVNEAATAFYGYTREEMLAKSIRDLRPADDLAALDRALAAELHGARRLGRWRHRHKDGRTMTVEVEVGSALFDGVPARFVQLREQATSLDAGIAGEMEPAALLRNAAEAIVSIDDDGRITEFNPSAERLFGFVAEDIVGRELAETLIPPELRAQFRQDFANYLATGERHMIGCAHEMSAQRADGTRVAVEMTISEALTDDRRHSFVAILREVTEERRIEAHLCAEFAVAQAIAGVSRFEDAAEQILQAICECAGWDLGAVWRVDCKAGALRLVEVWTSANDRLEKFVALTRSTAFIAGSGMPGRAWARQEPQWLGDLEDAGPRLPHCHEAGRFGLRSVVAIPIQFEGEVLAVLELFSFADRRPDASFSELMESISSQVAQFLARVREHERLREANERFEALLEASPVGIFLVDVDLNVRYWSPAAERIFGWTQAEMIGQSYLRVVPAERQHETRALQQAVLRGEPVSGVSATRRRKDGSLVHVVLHGGPIHDERGRVTGIVGLIAEAWDRPEG